MRLFIIVCLKGKNFSIYTNFNGSTFYDHETESFLIPSHASRQMNQAYLGSIAYVDELVGTVIKALM